MSTAHNYDPRDRPPGISGATPDNLATALGHIASALRHDTAGDAARCRFYASLASYYVTRALIRHDGYVYPDTGDPDRSDRARALQLDPRDLLRLAGHAVLHGDAAGVYGASDLRTARGYLAAVVRP